MILRQLTVCAVSAVLTLTLLLATSGSDAQDATFLSIDVGTPSGCREADVGDEFEVRIWVHNVSELQSWEATIVHDIRVIEITFQDTRQFLAQEPGSNTIDGGSEPLPDINGRHFLAAGDLSASSESGSGVLAVLRFQAVGPGISTVGIPQFDINGDGLTDEGATLTRYGGAFIGDVNGDRFFDGPVEPAIVAVGTECNSVQTQSPTDPPTAGPPITGGSTETDGASPTTVASPPVNTGEGTDTDTTPTDGNPATDRESPRTTGENSPTEPGRNPGGDTSGNGGSGSLVWLIVAGIVALLAAGAGVVAFAVRRSSPEVL